MIERKISFHNMDSSPALEEHANARIDKVEKLLANTGLPQSIDIKFKFNPHGANHAVEVHLFSRIASTEAHAAGNELYKVLEEAMDKTVEIIKKIHNRHLDDLHKVETEKTAFYKKD